MYPPQGEEGAEDGRGEEDGNLGEGKRKWEGGGKLDGCERRAAKEQIRGEK